MSGDGRSVMRVFLLQELQKGFSPPLCVLRLHGERVLPRKRARGPGVGSVTCVPAGRLPVQTVHILRRARPPLAPHLLWGADGKTHMLERSITLHGTERDSSYHNTHHLYALSCFDKMIYRKRHFRSFKRKICLRSTLIRVARLCFFKVVFKANNLNEKFHKHNHATANEGKV